MVNAHGATADYTVVVPDEVTISHGQNKDSGEHVLMLSFLVGPIKIGFVVNKAQIPYLLNSISLLQTRIDNKITEVH